MTEHVYLNGPFTVKLIESGEDEVRPWESVECECEEYQSNETNPRISGVDERCRHIREAIMHHHFAQRVSAVEDAPKIGNT